MLAFPCSPEVPSRKWLLLSPPRATATSTAGFLLLQTTRRSLLPPLHQVASQLQSWSRPKHVPIPPTCRPCSNGPPFTSLGQSEPRLVYTAHRLSPVYVARLSQTYQSDHYTQSLSNVRISPRKPHDSHPPRAARRCQLAFTAPAWIRCLCPTPAVTFRQPIFGSGRLQLLCILPMHSHVGRPPP